MCGRARKVEKSGTRRRINQEEKSICLNWNEFLQDPFVNSRRRSFEIAPEVDWWLEPLKISPPIMPPLAHSPHNTIVGSRSIMSRVATRGKRKFHLKWISSLIFPPLLRPPRQAVYYFPVEHERSVKATQKCIIFLSSNESPLFPSTHSSVVVGSSGSALK